MQKAHWRQLCCEFFVSLSFNTKLADLPEYGSGLKTRLHNFKFVAYLSTPSKTSTTLSASQVIGTVFGCMILLVAVVWFSVFAYLKYTRPVRNTRISDLPKRSTLSQGFVMDTLILNSQRYSLLVYFVF